MNVRYVYRELEYDIHLSLLSSFNEVENMIMKIDKNDVIRLKEVKCKLEFIINDLITNYEVLTGNNIQLALQLINDISYHNTVLTTVLKMKGEM